MHQPKYYVYIVTNKSKTVLYTGITNDLKRRLKEHSEQRGKMESFAGRYNTCYLIYYETFTYIRDAIAREKEIKGWREEKKMNLITSINPFLHFLNDEAFDQVDDCRSLLRRD